MSSSSRLVELSTQIAENTKTVDSWLEQQGIALSHEVDSAEAFPANAPSDILDARRLVREATKELNILVTGPAEFLRWQACVYHDMSSLRWVYHFKLADYVPLEGSISYEEVAQKAGVNDLQCKRIMRHAMTNHIFREPKTGYVAHTAASALLVRNRGVRDWVGFTTEESFLCAAKLVEATEKWAKSERKDQWAYNLAFDTELSMFEHMAQFPERAERFANTMMDMTSTDAYNIRHLVNGFAWDRLAAGSIVVDVGGSTGHASIAIADKFKSLRFVVQDLADVVQQGQELLKSQPEEIQQRIQFEVHDFFTTQPPRPNAAVYLMRFILHDHPDHLSTKILQGIVSAMQPGDRIVVMDGITPEPNLLPPSEDRIIRIMDLEMMTDFNSGEREKNQWEALYTAADPRLKLKNIVKPAGSVNSVMEVVLEDKVDEKVEA
ncbi:hypothetical protein AC578_1612 [Pseudocercospora eumusae]|uniref:Uncharacterized protein n=1 Tax=Pseudocercospora eumusae TaxID=321146 RepID=A0A139HM86_9PEZI|nr:hypothetical protein AC578_1612 [Pseudocercospora eumusae]